MKPSPFSVASRLPAVYKKFREKLLLLPEPVHYIRQPGRYVIDPETKEPSPVRNVPIPLKFPKEADEGIWGGEGVVKGFNKDKRRRRRFPTWWIPNLRKTMVYSEILNKYLDITVTNRTLLLIDERHGFDNYILETPVQDLKSQLALDIRREMYLTLLDKTCHHDDPEIQERVFEKYMKFAIPREEAEWFGLSFREAVQKQALIEFDRQPIPLKHVFRQKLVAQLKAKAGQTTNELKT